jgi:mRNA interferase MazF
MVNYIPKRGDFIALTFDPQAGHEQKGTRPALVVSRTAFNKRMGFVLVCPLTNTQRKNAFHIPVTARKLTGYIMAEQLKSLDYRARRAKFIEKCDPDLLQEVLDRIEPILF